MYRIQANFSKEQYDKIKELSKMTGYTMSYLVSDATAKRLQLGDYVQSWIETGNTIERLIQVMKEVLKDE